MFKNNKNDGILCLIVIFEWILKVNYKLVKLKIIVTLHVTQT